MVNEFSLNITDKCHSIEQIGVVCASISSGFGELTILQLTSFYAKYTVSAWSSGTGAAGLLGALSYAALTGLLKLAPKTAILILLFIPVIQVFRYRRHSAIGIDILLFVCVVIFSLVVVVLQPDIDSINN